jgi:hypothetical protein
MKLGGAFIPASLNSENGFLIFLPLSSYCVEKEKRRNGKYACVALVL